MIVSDLKTKELKLFQNKSFLFHVAMEFKIIFTALRCFDGLVREHVKILPANLHSTSPLPKLFLLWKESWSAKMRLSELSSLLSLSKIKLPFGSLPEVTMSVPVCKSKNACISKRQNFAVLNQLCLFGISYFRD